MQYWYCYPACLVLALVMLPGPVKAQTPVESAFRVSDSLLIVDVLNGHVSLKARNVSIRQLLVKTMHKGGIRLVLGEPLDESVSLEFIQLPVQEAVHRVLRGRNYVLQCVNPLCPGTAPGERAQATLWVFSDESPGEYTVIPEMAVYAEQVFGLLERGIEPSLAELALALAEGDASVREEIVDLLGEFSNESTIPILEQALKDREMPVREAAIAALLDVGSEEAALALAVALNDENPSVREDAVDAIGEIGGKTAIRLLQQALGDRKDLIREAAAEYLSDLSSHQQ